MRAFITIGLYHIFEEAEVVEKPLENLIDHDSQDPAPCVSTNQDLQKSLSKDFMDSDEPPPEHPEVIPEESEEFKAKAKQTREKLGFADEPEGSMRAAMKAHMMDPKVAAVAKEMFEILPPTEDAPEELKMYAKMVTGQA